MLSNGEEAVRMYFLRTGSPAQLGWPRVFEPLMVTGVVQPVPTPRSTSKLCFTRCQYLPTQSLTTGSIFALEGVIRPWISVLLVLLLVVGAAERCWAHAVLVESTPTANSTVKGPNLDITLRYNVRIDAGRSTLHLVAPHGTISLLPIGKQTSPGRLQSHAAGLTPGAYKLQWQVLAADGHITRGEIPFAVN